MSRLGNNRRSFEPAVRSVVPESSALHIREISRL
jgi:hypothetical protein